jgi:hypothetical protein
MITRTTAETPSGRGMGVLMAMPCGMRVQCRSVVVAALVLTALASPAWGQADALAALRHIAKPPVEVHTFQGCGPGGTPGSDDTLNRLKNRVDPPDDALAVAFHLFLSLKWPKAVERRDRQAWGAADTAFIDQFEGAPVRVEGFLAGARAEDKETPNCGRSDPDGVDFHIWLVEAPRRHMPGSATQFDRRRAIVIEATPRVRAQHVGWTVPALGDLARRGTRVRITGWLMFDQEHPEQVKKTRGTLWEIHPITRIESETAPGQWHTLEP